jgi:hypothetical protein
MGFARRLALAVCLAALHPSLALSAPSRPTPRPDPPPREHLILKLKPGNRFLATKGSLRSRAPGLDQALARHQAREATPLFPEAHADQALRETLGLDRFYVVSLDRGADVRAAVADLAKRDDVDAVERPAEAHAVATQSVIPNDKGFPDQWSLRNTGRTCPMESPARTSGPRTPGR